MMEQDGLGQGFNVAGQLMGSGVQAASGAIAATIGFAEQILNLTVRGRDCLLPVPGRKNRNCIKSIAGPRGAVLHGAGSK